MKTFARDNQICFGDDFCEILLVVFTTSLFFRKDHWICSQIKNKPGDSKLCAAVFLILLLMIINRKRSEKLDRNLSALNLIVQRGILSSLASVLA